MTDTPNKALIQELFTLCNRRWWSRARLEQADPQDLHDLIALVRAARAHRQRFGGSPKSYWDSWRLPDPPPGTPPPTEAEAWGDDAWRAGLLAELDRVFGGYAEVMTHAATLPAAQLQRQVFRFRLGRIVSNIYGSSMCARWAEADGIAGEPPMNWVMGEWPAGVPPPEAEG